MSYFSHDRRVAKTDPPGPRRRSTDQETRPRVEDTRAHRIEKRLVEEEQVLRRWRRGLMALGAFALLVLLAYGHVRYWYSPRARPSTPAANSRVATLLDDERFPAALWLPYPHQNLAVLDPAAAEHQAFMTAFARLTELPPPVLPSFGGFAVVPSSELALAADRDGERFIVMAQVYPTLAIFSRLAGRIADNPWLAGGPVAVQGRPAEVRWEGNLWIVEGGEPRAAGDARADGRGDRTRRASDAATADASSEDAFGLLSLHEAAGPFAPDLYRLGIDAGALEVRSHTQVSPGLWQAAEQLGARDMVMLMAAGPASERGVQALVLFPRDEDSSDLPRSATLLRTDTAPSTKWRVPGASFARLAGDLEEIQEGAWHIEAFGATGLASARGLLSRLEVVAGGRTDSIRADSLAWGLWADLDNTHAEIGRLARLAARVPLLPRSDARRLRDAEVVLRPVAARFEDLIIVVGDDPPALRLRLSRRPPGL